MHLRLVNYLRDNRDHILENWLTEADLPLPTNAIPFDGLQGTVPIAFLEGAFERVIERLSGVPCTCNGHNGSSCKPRVNGHQRLGLDDFLNVTCACRLRRMGGRVCIELHESGLRAFKSVFEEGWGAEEEFDNFERIRCAELINCALSGVFGEEVQDCQHRHERPDCPFAINR